MRKNNKIGDPVGRHCACGAIGVVLLKGQWSCLPCIRKDKVALEMAHPKSDDPDRKYLKQFHVCVECCQ